MGCRRGSVHPVYDKGSVRTQKDRSGVGYFKRGRKGVFVGSKQEKSWRVSECKWSRNRSMRICRDTVQILVRTPAPWTRTWTWEVNPRPTNVSAVETFSQPDVTPLLDLTTLSPTVPRSTCT